MPRGVIVAPLAVNAAFLWPSRGRNKGACSQTEKKTVADQTRAARCSPLPSVNSANDFSKVFPTAVALDIGDMGNHVFCLRHPHYIIIDGTTTDVPSILVHSWTRT